MSRTAGPARTNDRPEGFVTTLGTYPMMREHKITTWRQQIFRVLADNCGKHLSAYDIYSELRKTGHFPGMATIYRTVHLFTKIGMARSVDLGDGCKRYELCLVGDGNRLKSSRHAHLFCLECGSIIEIEFDILQLLEKQLQELKFKVDNFTLMIYGRCKECLQGTC